MEDRLFDQLARESAGAPTRRTLVHGLAALVGAAGVGLGLTLDAEAKKNKKKKRRQKQKKKEKKYECDAKGKVCATPLNPCEQVACEDHKCVTSNIANGTSCGNGLECNAGQCVCPNGVCVVKVSPADMGGWAFYDDNNDVPAATAMEFGPATPPFGVGSALLEVPDGTKDKLISAHIFNGTPLADFAELQYSVYVKSAVNGLAPSLQLGIDLDPDDNKTGWQGRLVFVPNSTGPIATGAWHTFNVLDDNFGDGTGNWYFTRSSQDAGNNCPANNKCTWSEVLQAFPKIRIHPQGPDDKPGAGLGFIGAKVGRDAATNANVDGLRIKLKGSGAATTIYNFEPNS
ncbi:MAG: hypothetical protein KC432_13195 [Thermomicrobiales bacterium]|nr:hypothetical protein [Thermomicrobiales bacterium]